MVVYGYSYMCETVLVYGYIVYGYMFIVAKTYEIPFVPWASVTLFWVGLMCALVAIMNTSCYIHHFTRFSGELFGLLIASVVSSLACSSLQW